MTATGTIMIGVLLAISLLEGRDTLAIDRGGISVVAVAAEVEAAVEAEAVGSIGNDITMAQRRKRRMDRRGWMSRWSSWHRPRRR